MTFRRDSQFGTTVRASCEAKVNPLHSANNYNQDGPGVSFQGLCSNFQFSPSGELGDPKTARFMYPVCPHVGPQDGRREVATSDLSPCWHRELQDGRGYVATSPMRWPLRQ